MNMTALVNRASKELQETQRQAAADDKAAKLARQVARAAKSCLKQARKRSKLAKKSAKKAKAKLKETFEALQRAQVKLEQLQRRVGQELLPGELTDSAAVIRPRPVRKAASKPKPVPRKVRPPRNGMKPAPITLPQVTEIATPPALVSKSDQTAKTAARVPKKKPKRTPAKASSIIGPKTEPASANSEAPSLTPQSPQPPASEGSIQSDDLPMDS